MNEIPILLLNSREREIEGDNRCKRRTQQPNDTATANSDDAPTDKINLINWLTTADTNRSTRKET